jgi:hypothetical protein
MKESTQLAKLMLLNRKELTVAYMDRRFKTNNSAEIINRLRKSGMPIETRWEKNEDTGKEIRNLKQMNSKLEKQYCKLVEVKNG